MTTGVTSQVGQTRSGKRKKLGVAMAKGGKAISNETTNEYMIFSTLRFYRFKRMHQSWRSRSWSTFQIDLSVPFAVHSCHHGGEWPNSAQQRPVFWPPLGILQLRNTHGEMHMAGSLRVAVGAAAVNTTLFNPKREFQTGYRIAFNRSRQ